MTILNLKFDPPDPQELRLDMYMLEEFKKKSELSKWTRSQIKNLIESGAVVLNNKQIKKPGVLIKPGSLLEITLESDRRLDVEQWDIEIPVLYEDKSLIVINKPQGISMHPGAGHKDKTIVNAMAAYFSKDLLEKDVRAGVVHRLDKDTTGIVVLAKNVEIHHSLCQLFAKREIKKTYQALVMSTPRSKRIVNKQDSGEIETMIARDPKSRTKMSVSKEDGKKALTSWLVKERMSYACLLEIDLKTGRTHQIRVHFNHVNSPIIGDITYGDFSALPLKLKKIAENFGRQALHASELAFKHPVNGKLIKLKAELPQDMESLIDEFRKFKA